MNEKINYQKLLDGEIASLNGRVPRLLLHVCCAPCSSYVLEYLSEFFEITVFYYNPNIEPESEYLFRAAEEERLRQQEAEEEAKLPFQQRRGYGEALFGGNAKRLLGI